MNNQANDPSIASRSYWRFGLGIALFLAASIGLNIVLLLSKLADVSTGASSRSAAAVEVSAPRNLTATETIPTNDPNHAPSIGTAPALLNDPECTSNIIPLRNDIADSRRQLAEWMQADLLWREESSSNPEAPPPGVREQLDSGFSRVWPAEGDVVGFDLDCKQHVCRTSVTLRRGLKDPDAWHILLQTDPTLSPMFQNMTLAPAGPVVSVGGETLDRYTIFSKIPTAAQPKR